VEELVECLSRELGIPIASATGIGAALVEAQPEAVKFFIPKVVTRGNTVRVDGYIGLCPAGAIQPQTKGEPRLDLAAGAWLTNILNLPWLLSLLYFERGETKAAAQRLAPALRDAFTLLPSNFADVSPPAVLPIGKLWQEDSQAWLIGRLRRRS
jgi:hypothetical protein